MSESDTSGNEYSASELVESPSEEIGKLTLDIGDYVIIYYENSYFPGLVVFEKK